jgi:hypothetical protein
MLRRISLIAASAAVLGLSAFSALPVSAAPMQSSTHKISFPGLRGVDAWGNYQKSGAKVKVSVCAGDTVRSDFASAAVVIAYNSNYSQHAEIGAVDIGYHEAVCRTMALRYTAHLRVYTFIGTNKGRISAKSKTKNIY